MEKLCDETINLINAKQEGSYWDFKQQWHSTNGDLVHDIICMSNNLENRDAYIIIGIDDKTFAIKDVSADIKRKTTQNIVDLLRSKKFAGGLRPVVFVTPLQIGNNIIDVITVKNSITTPYYLEEKYDRLQPHHIYTRVQDTNTPVDKSADINHIEYLWRKRFGLAVNPLEQLKLYIQDVKNWEYTGDNEPDNLETRYYNHRPEFTMSIVIQDGEFSEEIYSAIQINFAPPRGYTIIMRYHQTAIASDTGMSLDGGRYFTIMPSHMFLVSQYEKTQHEFSGGQCHYYIKTNLEYLLKQFFDEIIHYDVSHQRKNLMRFVLEFETEDEFKGFRQYVGENIDSFRKQFNEIKDDDIYVKAKSEHTKQHLINDYKSAMVYKNMFEEFKNKDKMISICI